MKRRIRFYVLLYRFFFCARVIIPVYIGKGCIDFNKNSAKDIYEDPSAPIEAEESRPAVQ